MDAHPRQDGVHQLTLRQGEVGIMIGGQDVAPLYLSFIGDKREVKIRH